MTNKSKASQGRALRPRARILRTLGEELISSEIVAILELVKNSYDADARIVLVSFSASLEKGHGRLDISDDGHGMDLETVETAWMEPATDTKKKARFSKYLKRRLLGEKGVGRFAAARLAEELELITKSPDSHREIYALFDWTQFDHDDRYLDEVLILAEERIPREFVSGRSTPIKVKRVKGDLPRDGGHGTVLRMSKLKRTWTEVELNDLHRGLSRLISPFETDKKFRIFLQLPHETASTAQEVEAPEVIKYPHYSIDGTVSDKGRYTLTIHVYSEAETKTFTGWFRRDVSPGQTTVGMFEVADDETRPIICGALSFRVLVWDRDQLDNINQKLGTGIRSIRRDLDSIAGISIYRDGFRVLPYGEPDNDWLRLDIRRVQNPTMRLSNNQLTGYITIGADSNPELRDQSNREGLNNNQAYTELQSIMLLSLSKLEELRYSEKKKLRQSVAARAGGLFETPNLTELRGEILKLRPNAETIKLFDETTRQWEEQVTRIREVVSRYHSLATLGQLVDKVVHDSRQPLSTIQVQATLAYEVVEASLEGAENDACREILSSILGRLKKVRDAAGMVDSVLKRVEPLGGRRRGRPTKLYLEEIIRDAFAHFEKEIHDLGIKTKLPQDMNLVRVDPAELQEVLVNLLSNSLHWLRQVPKEKRSIVVQCARPQAGEVQIVFADSGPGVPRENRESIFEPYFTTKPEGVGLGLVIAGEVIRDYYDGNLELLDSGPLGGAVFRITLRKRV
jgi:signal transduction histidine kinase